MKLTLRGILPKSFINFWIDHWRGVLLLFILIPSAMFIKKLIDMHTEQEVHFISSWKSDTLRCFFVYCLMAVLWLTNVIPIHITGVLPVVFFPIWRIQDGQELCSYYFGNSAAIFIGIMMMELAVEYCNLHKRIALFMVLLIGKKPRRILWALVVVSTLMSMCLSNTTTTIVMCSIVEEVIYDLEEQGIIDAYDEVDAYGEPRASRVASGFYLSVTYAATIGGTGTLIGTGNNLALKGLYQIRFPDEEGIINFITFSAYSLPVVLLFTIFLCLWIQLIFLRKIKTKNVDNKTRFEGMYNLRASYNALSKISIHEIQILILLSLMILFSATKGTTTIKGWADSNDDDFTRISVSIIGVVLLLFLLPKNYNFLKIFKGSGPFEEKESESLLNASFALRSVPWSYILIIGGGRALLSGIHESGMDTYLLDVFTRFRDWPNWSLQLSCITFVMVLAIFAPNIIICNLTFPLLSQLATACHIHPLYLIFPATLAQSYSFLLPTGTPGNQYITFYANVPVKYMLLAGIGPTLMGILLVFLHGQTWHAWFFSESMLDKWVISFKEIEDPR